LQSMAEDLVERVVAAHVLTQHEHLAVFIENGAGVETAGLREGFLCSAEMRPGETAKAGAECSVFSGECLVSEAAPPSED
jgi:hypothetical protein